MDVNNVASLISSVGFPIVACIALFWYIVKCRNGKCPKCNTEEDEET